jgi:ArsR family transcriptional regulator, arsenate/arsenite/antimonite-responsive transcriptional repressor
METITSAAPVTETAAVKALAALAQVQRLRAFRALVQAGQAGLTPGVLATAEQQGRNLIYRADFAQMTQLMAYLTENCCAADPSGAACC